MMPEIKSIILNNTDIEEFWDDLLTFIEDRRVIPVVGAELHTIIVMLLSSKTYTEAVS